MTSCYHCGLPVPASCQLTADIGGTPQLVCCLGCQAVAEAICQYGLADYYHRRTSHAEQVVEPDDQILREWQGFDQPQVQQTFVSTNADGEKQATLAIDGMTCAACAWLIEKHLESLPGLIGFSLNLTTRRGTVEWHPEQCKLSHILLAIHNIGYRPRPFLADGEEQQLQIQKRGMLQRIGLAGLGAMQNMMFAVALYGGDFSGMSDDFISLFRWVSLMLATPVVLFSAGPFFQAAWKNLRHGHLVMDLPVALAIGLAWTASTWVTIFGGTHVYFDSVCMFTFFLLIGRYLELNARVHAATAGNALSSPLPMTASRLAPDTLDEEIVPLAEISTGDLLRIPAGSAVPADGTIQEGQTHLDESILTGESAPVFKQKGDTVLAGTINVESPVTLCVTRHGANTVLSSIFRLMENAMVEKPPVAWLADRISGFFIAGLLVIAGITYGYWQHADPNQAFSILLAVLVVACPCALSLATPTALTVAIQTLQQQGLLIRRGLLLEVLPKITDIIFDKTGTLTEAEIVLKGIHPASGDSRETLLHLATALERDISHPLSRAFRESSPLQATQVKSHIGEGVAGTIDGKRYHLGKPDFAMSLSGLAPPDPPSSIGIWILLASVDGPCAWFHLGDALRSSAADTVAQYQQAGIQVHILSGDQTDNVRGVAGQLGITQAIGDATPADKLAYLTTLKQSQRTVLMVGDGINDLPVLAGAQGSIAMASAADITRIRADGILVSGDLGKLIRARNIAIRCQGVIRQNILWALGYNFSLIPIAAMGFVPPWLAAIGMSLSSLLVILNALRLKSTPKPPPPFRKNDPSAAVAT